MRTDSTAPHGDLRAHLQRALGSAYTLEHELGGGGMSRVFVARDEALGRDVVVKVLAPELAEGMSAERFARETKLAAALQEPHIVPVLTAGTAGDGLPYYTMPFVRGESLRARLARGPVPLAEAVGILRDLACALAYAHAQGIVHRDVKPENVLLSSGTAVVTDFGIAKALQLSKLRAPDGAADSAGAALTELGASLGTPAYMAPEQAAGDPATDHRADIYAWGVVAYELLAGRHPFAGITSPHQLVMAHLARTPAPLAGATGRVPVALEALVMRALAKDPATRPQAATEIVAALDAIRAGGGHAPRRGRGRPAAAVMAVVALALLAGLVARARAPRPAAPPIIAVLPFESVGPAPDASFAGGLSDAVAGKLSRLAALRVIDQASTTAGRAAGAAPAAWGKALGADYVLRATIRWARGADGEVRAQVTPVLVRVTDGTTKWAGDPEVVTAADPFAVQAEIAARVADALDLALAPAESARLAAAPTGDTAAYAAYVRGTQILRDGSALVLPRLREAYAELARASARDPRFADAAGAAAQTAMRLAEWGDPASFQDSARTLAQRALTADPAQVDAVGVMAALLGERGDLDGAHAMIERASRSNPSSVGLLQMLAGHAAGRGDTAAAWALTQRAVRLAPRSADALHAGVWAARLVGRDEAARDLLRRAQALGPASPDLLVTEMELAFRAGDSARVVQLVREYRTRSPRQTLEALELMRYGDEATRREVAAASPEAYGVNNMVDSLHFYATRAEYFLSAGDARRARAVADSGWAVATRPRDAASLAKSCQRCMANVRARLAAVRGDRAAAMAALAQWTDSAAVRRWPDGVAASGMHCFRASLLGTLGDVDALAPAVRQCMRRPSRPTVHSLFKEYSLARWRDDPRIRAAAGLPGGSRGGG